MRPVDRLLPFLAWRKRISRETLRADLVAGLVSAVIVLPQGVAFATLAGMPPEYGLYGAMLPAIVGALWGSSWQLISGPTNATSLMVFATIGTLATPFGAEYIRLVLTLSLMIGIIKLALGLARLGALVNFVSNTVVVGFTAGAALLIIAAQLRNFFGLDVAQEASFQVTLTAFATHIGAISPAVTAVGVVTLVTALVSKRLLPRFPYMLTGIVLGSVFAYVLSRAGVAQVPTLGALPSAFPSLSHPDFSPATWQLLAPSALALTVIGLSEAVSSGRAIAMRTGQRIDGNQEFIGQGLANIAGAFTSSYPTSGSFNRTAANFEAGAKTQLAGIFAAFFLLAILVVVAPLAAFLPTASMAAILFLVAWGLIDFQAVRRVAGSGRGELLTLLATFIAVLTIRLEVAILIGVLTSLLVYLNRTTHPQLSPVVPDGDSAQRQLMPAGANARCPQLAMLRVDGSLFFGAVEHVRDALAAARRASPHVNHWLLIGSGINFIDAAGCEMLAVEARESAARGGALYLCNLKPAVYAALESGGYIAAIGADRIFARKRDAVSAIYAQLDAAICATCTARIFTECGPSPSAPTSAVRNP